MIVKKTNENGETYYVNAFTGKKVSFKRVGHSNPPDPKIQQMMVSRSKGIFYQPKTKAEKLRDKYSFIVKRWRKLFREIGENSFNKAQFILDSKRIGVNPYLYI